MILKRELEDAILAAACQTEGQAISEFINVIFATIGDDAPSKKTIRRTIEDMRKVGYLSEKTSTTIHLTKKGRRMVAECQEEAA